MYKYVLFTLIISAILAVFAPFTVSAEYFNGSHLEEKSKDFIKGEDYDIKPDEEYIETLREFTPEDFDVDLLTVGIRSPQKYPQPLLTVTDSIYIGKSHVKRKTEIPGVRLKSYYFIQLEEYKKMALEEKQEELWRKNDSRIRNWSSEKLKDGTSISDLQFALPVGKKFESLMGGKTRLDINGSQKITFSGRSEWTEGQIETSVSKNSSFPALTMKQEPRFSIRGNVGERIAVDIQQDASSQSFSNLEENVRISYKGEENEIIQSIEAGSISLNLPGATFAGYRGSHKGLFGISTEGQLGPLKFTAIASQEKSEANVKSFRGSAEESSAQIRDYQYKTNTYFFLDKRYMNRFADDRTSLDLIIFDPADSISTLEVYVDDGNSGNNLNENTFALRGVAVPENMDTSEIINDPTGIEGYYHRLDPQRDYYVDRNLGFIVFTSRIQDSWTAGVFMRTKGGQKFGDLSYDPDDDTSKIHLKLIKAKNQRPSNKDTWNLEWKNVYDLGQRNIDIEGLEIRIYREATDGVSRDTQDGTPYIHILGLDKADEFGNPKPDNKIDLNRGFVNQYRGELIFPLLRPFDSEPPAGVSVSLEEKVPEIYETNNYDEKIEASKYYIEVKTATRAAVIRIGGGLGGIMEGTEQVILNGNPLQAGTDYRISYTTGEITLLNEEAMSPTADLVIKYEELSAFQQMQKTLLGVRGEYDLFDQSRIGTTLLFNNESTREKRVRLGQEPSRMFLFDTDVLLNFQPKFLTAAIDKIPLIEASEISNIQIEGEVARSMPNMNTKGMVYVDDFEGSRNTALSVTRTNWSPASIPDEATTGGVTLQRGRLQWYNPWDRIASRKIWPNKETTAGENTVHVLTLAYGADSDNEFAGIQTAFYGAGDDLSRARFLEIWARGGEGLLKFDIGSISEDFYPFDTTNGSLDTEDKPIPGQGQGDGVLVPEEDTGLDGVPDAMETGEGEDPHGDNWDYSEKNDYSHINGMEGNGRDSDRAGFPDTEDINNNGILDVKNAYYEYTIDFEDNSENNKYLVQDSVPVGNPSSWRLFRIPLWNNPDVVVGGMGAPDSTLIEYARMWVTDADTTFIQIASIEVVENSWLERGIFDSEDEDITETAAENGAYIKVTRVNTDENLNYSPPPGVKIEIDPDTKIRRMEQSLVMEFEKLASDNTAFIYRTFDKMDFTDYTSLKMYVHGSDTENMPEAAEGGRDIELVFRFGGDKENYYEYRTPIYKGWARESFVDIELATCTAVKFNLERKKESVDKSAAIIDSLLLALSDSLLAEENSLQVMEEPLTTSAGRLEKEAEEFLTQGAVDSINEFISLVEKIYLSPDEPVQDEDNPLTAVRDLLQTVGEELKAEKEFMNAPGVYSETFGDKVFSLGGRPSLQNIKVISIGVRNNLDEDITGDVWFDELRLDELRAMGGTAARVKFNTDLAGFISVTGNATSKSKDFHDMNTKKGTGKDTFNWNSSVKVNLDRFTPKRWNLNLPVSANIGGSEALPWLKSGSDIELNKDQKKEYSTTTSDKKYHITYRKGVDTSRPTDTFFRKAKSGFINWTTEKVSADFDMGERHNQSPVTGMAETNSMQLKVTYDVNPPKKTFEPLGWILKKIGRAEGEEEDEEEESKKKPGRAKETSFIDKITGFSIEYTPNELNYNNTYDEKNVYKTNIDGVSDTTKTSNISEEYNFGYRPIKSLTYRFNLTKAYDKVIGQQVSYVESNTLSYKPPGFFKLITHNYSYTTSYNEKDNPRYSMTSQLGSKTINFRNSFSATVNLTWYNILEKLKSIPKIEEENGAGEKTTNEKTSGGKSEPKKDSSAPAKNQKPAIPLRNKAVEALMEVFTPVTLDYKMNNQLNYGGIKDRPRTFLDRFKGNIDEPDTSTVVTRQNTSGGNISYSARSDLKLPFDMGLSAKMSFDSKEQTTSSAQTENHTFNYPDVTFKWSNVEGKIPFIKKYFSNMQLNTNYSANNQKAWQDGNPEPKTDKTSTKISQSVNTRILKNIQTNFSFSLDRNESADLSGETKSFTIDDKKDIKSRVSYRLTTSGGMLFFKNVKLRSDIDIAIDFGISSSVTRKKIGEDKKTNDETGGSEKIAADTAHETEEDKGDGYTKIGSSDSWYVTPNITYSFSRKFKGGAKIDIRNSVDLTGKEHKTREVQIWGELIF